MILDTEFIQKKGEKDTYNFGYVVVDTKELRKKNGNINILLSRSIVITEIFDKMLLNGSFGQNKIDILVNYKLNTKKYEFIKIKDFKNLFIRDLQKFNVKLIWGYNVAADKTAVYDFFKGDPLLSYIDKNIIFADIMYNCKKLFVHTKKYIKFCDENNYKTIAKSGKIYYKCSAETMYRFLVNREFCEEHTALSDVFCEIDLLRFCYIKRKKLYVKKGVGLKETLQKIK